VAAVAGRHFDVEVVADVASIEIDTALAVLDSAIAAGLIDEDKQRLGWFRFTDALVAEALYETTGRMRRGRLHLRIEAAAGGAWATERAAGGLAPAAIGPRTVGDRGHESAGPGPAGGTTMVMAMGGRRGRGVEQRTPSRRQPLKSPSQVAWPMLRQGVDFARLERNVA
jgi:hypothetical protein